ncbi:MAG: A24 family peptidase [Candidatus Wallacebacter cryptica]|jgi:prepilin signal peptidase PulO-like enzyme (type II secretory pathway)|nr:prepilin peptidase [Bacillota bacterium]
MALIWLLFSFGLVFGSFYNVLIYRIPKGKSIVFPRSQCPDCGHTLTAWELIPVFSYLIQRGKCRSCGEKISWEYPVVELTTAVGFAVCAYTAGSLNQLAVRLVFFSLLLIASVIDFKHKILPNVITIPGIILGVLAAVIGWTIPLTESLIGIFVGGGILFVIAAITRGMGMGDVKFLAMIGAFIGPLPTLGTLFLGSLFGSVSGIIYLAITKQGRKTPIPFGPFLALGAVVSALYFF